MTPYDVAYAIAAILLFGFEFLALWQQSRGKVRGQTVSHKVIRWISKKPKTRRTIVGIGLVWLLYHWVFQEF